MPKITIRTAGEGDIPAVVALYRQLDQALVDLQPEFFCVAPRGMNLSARPSRPRMPTICWRRRTARWSVLRW